MTQAMSPDETRPDNMEPDAPDNKPEGEGREFLENFLDPKPEEVERDLDLEFRVAEMLRTIYDPEIPVNIYELGLIYGLTADKNGRVKVVMTLTTPHCPVAESMPGEVETKVYGVDGVKEVDVELTWDPPWDQTMMSEAARLELGFL